MTLDEIVQKERGNFDGLADVVNNGGKYKMACGAEIVSQNHKKSSPFWYRVGQITNLPFKLLYWFRKAGTQPTYENVLLTARVIEDDPDLWHTRWRLGNSSVTEELKRLWTDPHIKNTRGLLTRILGTPGVILAETLGKIFRMDHYNGWTNTATSYTPKEALQLNLMGLSRFVERSHMRLVQILGNVFVIGSLWQGPYAVRFANKRLPKHLRTQTYRYLTAYMGIGVGGALGYPIVAGAITGYIAGYIGYRINKSFQSQFPDFIKKYDDLMKMYETRKKIQPDIRRAMDNNN